jgi:Holliday junction resolvase RusA-like endonuclease
LRVRGISHQSASSETLRDLTREVKNRLLGRNVSANSALRFCLALTFVVNKSRKDRDLDNMAKATQDAVSRALNFDDARIVHLDVVKLSFSDAEECVYLRLATSSLNTHNDVVGAYFNHSFGGQQPLQVKH